MHPLKKSGDERYPIPETYPKYTDKLAKIPGNKRFSVADLLEFAAVIIGAILTIWLGVLIALKGISFAVSSIFWLVLFWAVMAYLALPRLHQFFAALYVPNYFIARTRTVDGVLADPVNLALEGSAADIHTAMRKAGWVKADEITLGSAWGIIKSSVFGTSYPQAPVSDLFLFQKKQAFAYQQEVDGNAAQRHHIRFWPTPPGWVLPGGHKVAWLAAGTYDRSVGLSIFTGQVTHKIDADIDKERDYVINTVRYADSQCSVEIIKDFSTAYHHRNGGGDLVYTDGALPVLNVAGSAERHPEYMLDAQAINEDKISAPKKQHHLPPTAFLLTGVILISSLILASVLSGVVLTSVLATGENPLTNSELFLNPSTGTIGIFGVLTAIIILTILWVLTAKRSRVARILLLGFAIIGAVQDLITASISEQLDGSNLITAGVSVLVLWAISSDAVRIWVNGENRESTK